MQRFWNTKSPLIFEEQGVCGLQLHIKLLSVHYYVSQFWKPLFSFARSVQTGKTFDYCCLKNPLQFDLALGMEPANGDDSYIHSVFLILLSSNYFTVFVCP